MTDQAVLSKDGEAASLLAYCYAASVATHGSATHLYKATGETRSSRF